MKFKVPSGLAGLSDLVSNCANLNSKEKAFLLKQRKLSGVKFRLIKLFIIISRIKWGELIQSRNRDHHKHWVNLNTRKLEKACGCRNPELKVLLDALENLDVIEVNPKFLNAKFSRSYCFTRAYRRQKVVPCPLAIQLTNTQAKAFATGLSNIIAVHTDLEKWLYGNLCRLRFDASVMDYVNHRQFKHGSDDSSKAHAEMLIEAINADTKVVDGITRCGWFFTRENRVGRLFTPVISLHKDLRAFLRVDGQEVWEVDQHASQPFLLLKLYQQIAGGDAAAIQDEASRYYALWSSGNFYQRFVDLTGSGISADDMKQCVIKGALNCRNVNQPPKGVSKVVAKAIMAAYQQHFPMLYAEIHRIKTIRDTGISKVLKSNAKGKEKIHSQFGLKLQQIESGIFIDGIANELMMHGIYCYTIHDAIGCFAADIPMVTKIMEHHLTTAIGFKPTLKTSRPTIQTIGPG